MSAAKSKLNKIKNNELTTGFMDLQLDTGMHVVTVERFSNNPELPEGVKITETGFNKKKLVHRLYRKIFK